MKKQYIYRGVLIIRSFLIFVFLVLLSILILSIKRLFLDIDVINFEKYSLVLDGINNSNLMGD